MWEREVPAGTGVTGLWRPMPSAAHDDMIAIFMGGGSDSVFTLHQSGDSISGTVEAPPGLFGTMGTGPIEDGKISVGNISFRAGGTTYSGSLKGDRIELQKSSPELPPGFSGPPPDSANLARRSVHRRMGATRLWI